jgi:exosortase D (VPLPA-CTERM-specific)
MPMVKMRPVWLLWLALLLVLALYVDQLVWLWNAWLEKEEYSHGLLMPFVSSYFLWVRRKTLSAIPMQPSWIGVLLLLLALLAFLGGSLAHLEVVKNHSLILAIAGIVWAYGGLRLIKETFFPLLLMFLVVPLPSLLNSMLTTELQLISSEIGAWVIRVFGIPVHLDGNVIDLGSFKMMVAEACSGLRYLFPLISLGVIAAYLYRGPMWHRVVLVVSTVPITVFTNSFRIGATGILVEYFGTGVAEGFLHDFEGWIVFLFAAVLLAVEMKLLLVLSGSRQSLADAFALPGAVPAGESDAGVPEISNASIAPPLTALLGIAVFLTYAHAGNLGENVVAERAPFDEFPIRLGEWIAKRRYLTIDVLDVLDADDYFIGDYSRPDEAPIQLYMAYHAQQQNGSALHSPEVCIPAGGWQITDGDKTTLLLPRGEINLRRMVIDRRVEQQLVYYWFYQQGRSFNDENVARASLLLSAFQSQRTDSSLVRFTTPIIDGDQQAAEQRLVEFIPEVLPHLNKFIPE